MKFFVTIKMLNIKINAPFMLSFKWKDEQTVDVDFHVCGLHISL